MGARADLRNDDGGWGRGLDGWPTAIIFPLAPFYGRAYDRADVQERVLPRSASFAELRAALQGTRIRRARGVDRVFHGDAGRPVRSPPDDRLRLLQGQRRGRRRLFSGDGGRGARHRAGGGDPLLPGGDAWRA